MTDPTALASLEGQQYLVLRPAGAVAQMYDQEQALLRALLPATVTHPYTGHVTLRGFHEPTRVPELKEAIAEWAARTPPIELRIEAIDGFPTPFQILIARLYRAQSLVDAYADLTDALNVTDFQRIGELPLNDWVFHLSLIYCNTLTEQSWRTVHARSTRDVEPVVAEVVSEAEYVWYEDGVEHTEVIPLGMR